MTQISLSQPHHSQIRVITVFVVAIHLAFIVALSWQVQRHEEFRAQPKKLIVQTISLKQNKQPALPKQIQKAPSVTAKETTTVAETPAITQESVEIKKIPAKESPPPVKQAKPTPKVQAMKEVVTKKGPAQNKTPQVKKRDVETKSPPKETLDEDQRALIAQAQERLQKVQNPSGKMSVTKENVPSKSTIATVGTLAIEATTPGGEGEMKGIAGTYQEELVARLKLVLRLPEYGNVKIRLILDSSGKVKQVTILSAESKKNKEYVEKMVPTLYLPPFGQAFPNLDSMTFTITLCNEL